MRRSTRKSNPLTRIEYTNNAVYIGQASGERPGGKGTMTYPNGAVYDGMWHLGKWNGKGKLTTRNGEVYDGNWSNYKPNGDCTYRDAEGREVGNGLWINGRRVDGKVFKLSNEIGSTGAFMNEGLCSTRQLGPDRPAPNARASVGRAIRNSIDHAEGQVDVNGSPQVGSPRPDHDEDDLDDFLGKIHITNASIEALHILKDRDSDFSHVMPALDKMKNIFMQKDVYIYDTIRNDADDNVDLIAVAFILEKGLVPTRTVYDEQREEVLSFDQVGYEWVEAQERLFYLRFNRGGGGYCSHPLFMITPGDLETKTKASDCKKYLEAVNWENDDKVLKDILVVQICAVNQQSKITSQLPANDKHVKAFQEYFEQKYLVSDHFLLENGTFPQVNRNQSLHKQLSVRSLSVFRDINDGWKHSLHDLTKAKCLLVTFCCATKCPCDYDKAVESFGLPRLCEFFGFDPDADEEINPLFLDFLHIVFENVAADVARKGMRADLRAYIMHDLFRKSKDSVSADANPAPMNLRLGSSPESALEVLYSHEETDYRSTSMARLQRSCSHKGIEDLIKNLLNQEAGRYTSIEAGFRDDSNLSGKKRKFEPRLANCVKAVLLLLSKDSNERHRIENALPDHESHFGMINYLLNSKVKTFQIRKPYKGDVTPQTHAMTVQTGLWMAECLIEGSTKKHSVLIDASDDSITDPVDDGDGNRRPKRLPRTDTSLKSLRIQCITKLREIIPRELKPETKLKLNEDPKFIALGFVF